MRKRKPQDIWERQEQKNEENEQLNKRLEDGFGMLSEDTDGEDVDIDSED